MGYLSLFDLNQINTMVIKKCMQIGLKVDFVKFCPHHPHRGYQGEVEVLKKYCFCRKPLPGMLLEMSFLYNINLKDSLVIGDSFRDRDLALNSGSKFKHIKDL